MTYFKNTFLLLAFSMMLASCGSESATQTETASEPETTAAPEQSGILEPVKWSFMSKSLGDDVFELTMTANMDDGWSIYSQHTSDDGPVPTSFEFESENFKSLSEMEEIGEKKEGMDPLFEVNVIKFTKGPVVFKKKLKVTDYTQPIAGYVTYMTCDDTRCLPPTDVDFSFKVKH